MCLDLVFGTFMCLDLVSDFFYIYYSLSLVASVEFIIRNNHTGAHSWVFLITYISFFFAKRILRGMHCDNGTCGLSIIKKNTIAAVVCSAYKYAFGEEKRNCLGISCDRNDTERKWGRGGGRQTVTD